MYANQLLSCRVILSGSTLKDMQHFLFKGGSLYKNVESSISSSILSWSWSQNHQNSNVYLVLLLSPWSLHIKYIVSTVQSHHPSNIASPYPQSEVRRRHNLDPCLPVHFLRGLRECVIGCEGHQSQHEQPPRLAHGLQGA